ncbi:MAG: heat shock protein transcriptional repressor HspR [Anaerolineae bacterium]
MAKVKIPIKRDPAARPRPAPDEPCYIISVAAQIVGLHPQTLRQYDRAGLVVAYRAHGNRRMYSPRDIRRLQRIVRLTEDLGINLAGVEVILNMRAQIKRMRREMDQR